MSRSNNLLEHPAGLRLALQSILAGLVLVVSSIIGPHAGAQDYMFTTLAGAGGPGAIDGPGFSARFNNPLGVAVDQAGNVYLADSYNATIRKRTPNGSVSTVAGLARERGASDGSGSLGRFNMPAALVVNKDGNLFVADQYNHLIRQISPAGMVTTLAGSAGQPGADDGNGSAARFNYPGGLALDGSGNLYVADTVNHTIRKITLAGEVSTVAGAAASEGSDDGIGTGARFRYPRGVAIGSDGTIYVADSENQTIRKITLDGAVSTLAGTAGQAGSKDGARDSASFNNPVSLTVDNAGIIYVADSLNGTIRKVTQDGIVSTLAGEALPPDPAGRPLLSYADGPGSTARFLYPQGIAADASGALYVADSGNNALRRITVAGVVTTLAGSSQTGADDGPGNVARFRHPTGVAVQSEGSLFVVDGDNNTVRQIGPDGRVTTVAGLAGMIGNVDGTGNAARFTGPRKLELDPAGNLFVADTANSTVRKMIPPQAPATGWEVMTFAGEAGSSGYADGLGAAARFNALYDVATDRDGNIYVADKDNQVIRKMTPDGVVTTLAGMAGVAGAVDGSGDQAQFNLPYGIATDGSSFIYVADTLNHTIRKITPAGEVMTLAGKPGVPGSDDGLGELARFNAPYGLAVDAGGNVYVADYLNNLIRRVTPEGLVTTLAGRLEADPDGYPLNGSEDGAANAARFYNPKDIAVDGAGTLYVADSFNNTIRMGTTNSCPDLPVVTPAVAPLGAQRQLDTIPQTAIAWHWSLIRRPANSQAALSSENIRNPTFTPDVADTYIFQLRATNNSGAIGVRNVTLVATTPPARILSSTLTSTNGQFSFTFEAVPGSTVEVEVSDDLIHWLALGTFFDQTGTFTIVDRSPDERRGFYRLRQL